MTRYIICFLLLFTFLTNKSLAQGCNSINDTFYVLLIHYELDNGRPSSGYFLIKDLETIDMLAEVSTRNDFMCILYKHGFIFLEPYFSLSEDKKCYFFEQKSTERLFYKRIYKNIADFNKYYSLFFKKKLSDGRRIQIECLKLYGEFWISKHMEINDEIYYEKCLEHTKTFSIKDVFKIQRLSQNEKERIANSIN